MRQGTILLHISAGLVGVLGPNDELYTDTSTLPSDAWRGKWRVIQCVPTSMKSKYRNAKRRAAGKKVFRGKTAYRREQEDAVLEVMRALSADEKAVSTRNVSDRTPWSVRTLHEILCGLERQHRVYRETMSSNVVQWRLNGLMEPMR